MRLTGLAVVLAVIHTLCSLTVQAQAGKVWLIGRMHLGLDHVPQPLVPLREELRALCYEDGRNIRLDFRNLADQAAANITAQQFVRDQVDLIVAFEEQAARGVKAATTAIPVVFLHLEDPVADGFVKSLAHPGGNVTGFVTWAVAYWVKTRSFEVSTERSQSIGLRSSGPTCRGVGFSGGRELTAAMP